MTYTSQEFQRAHLPWVFVDPQGRRHEARDISYREALRWFESFAWAGQDPWRQERVISRLVRRIFPASPARWAITAATWLFCPAAAVGLWRLRVPTGPAIGELLLLAAILGWAVARWARAHPDPWTVFRALPVQEQWEAIRDFFRRAGLGIPAQSPPPTISNASSATSSGTPSRMQTSVA